MKQHCFLCNKIFGLIGERYSPEEIESEHLDAITGFYDPDRICSKCVSDLRKERNTARKKNKCFNCKRDISKSEKRWFKEKLSHYDPRLSYNDVVCEDCLNEGQKNLEQLIKLGERERAIAKQKAKSEYEELLKREPEYKINWNKNGVIQFKNERIAILHRMWGSQVEFIIAFDDLTKEGYRLMVIDEGKTADAGGLSGGVSSYYYFQKITFVQ